MSIESIILLVTALLATIKAYFEWSRAKAESKRADNTEELLKHTIKSVESAKNAMNHKDEAKLSAMMKDYIDKSDCDSSVIHSIIKEVTEGNGDITKHIKK